MDDNGLRAVIIARGVIHRGIFVQILVRIGVCAALPSKRPRSVGVHSGFFLGIEALFLLKAESQALVIAFEEFAVEGN